MSLQLKFALMLGLIGLTVVLALVGGAISMNFMHEEVRRPFQSMSGALIQLEQIKLAVEQQRHILTRDRDSADTADRDQQRAAMSSRMDSVARIAPREPTDADRTEFARAVDAIQVAVRNLSSDDWSRMVTGGTTLGNLRERLSASRDSAEAWLQHGQHADREAAAESLLSAFDLIRRIESRVVKETHELLEHASDIRTRLRNVIAFTILATALACSLGVLLVRRWVLRPVAELRTAAARIAAGDFAHRVDVRGRDELADLSTEVNTMAAMVKNLQDEAVDRERLAAVGEMVKRIAHNLRSPMAGIRGLAEMTRADLNSARIEPGIRDDLGENQSRIIDAVDRFEHWLRDLLNATRPHQLNPAATDPREWLQRIVKAYLPAAQARGASICLLQQQAPSVVVFDPAQLELALGALIANALDAAAGKPDPNHPPEVRVTSRLVAEPGQSGDLWELIVQDNGPGVAEGLQDRIFKPYFTTKREGTGIGLALAQQIVRAHHGVLALMDSPKEGESTGQTPKWDHGAVFSIRLPVRLADEAPIRVAKAGHSEATSGQSSGH